MELEELKKVIDQKAEKIYALKHVSISQLKFHAGIKSTSLLNKILASLRWELGFSIAFIVGCIFLATFSTSVSIITFLALLIAYSSGFSIYLFRLHNHTRQQVVATGTVLSSVSGMIGIIERYTRLYLRLSTSFVPAVFLAALVASMIDFIQTNDSSVKIPYLAILPGALIVCIWIILMKKFTRWWMNRLYGYYLLELKACLQELNSEE